MPLDGSWVAGTDGWANKLFRDGKIQGNHERFKRLDRKILRKIALNLRF